MKIPNWRLNTLIGLNCFILFFLLFEHLVRVPVWMQVIGRVHPMLLHFPIVLLLMAGIFINFSRQLEKTLSIKPLIRETLFVAALTAAITVIMGLLLAQEEGYEGGNLQWHKWTGVGISFLSGVLVCAQGLQYTRYRFWFAAVTNLCLLLVLIAGHFGAALTHGEQFVFEPLKQNNTEVFDINTAQVFDDAVLPILKAKCLSCHNAGKSKGELILADSASMAKGGKNGVLLQAGNPMESLLIQRLLLDIEHEHHMPPKGKPQLTPEELTLLQAWVAKGAQFNLPVAMLNADDSLLLAIGAVYPIHKEENFDFPAADAKQIEKLSTPYRVIRVLADGSPALSVSFYGAGFYTDQALAELEPIAQQIVSLNVDGMPIGKQGLETVAKFKNLRDINLNDTPIDDAGLTALHALPKLGSVRLSGTAITAAGIKELLANDALRRVYIWNTPITNEEVSQLTASFPTKVVEMGFVDDGQTTLSLTVPQITPARTFFRDELQITMSHPIPGVEIRYSLDGKEPDSSNSTVFDKPISIRSNQQLSVKAFKEGWAPSPTIVRGYVRSAKTPDRIVMEGRPHYLYPARREISFFDLESGGNNHADGKWQGYLKSPLSAVMHFDEPTAIDTLTLSVMQNYQGITYMPVYAPEYIEVWGGADTTEEKLLAKLSPVPGKPEQLEGHRLIDCPIHTTNLRYLKLIARPYRKIPDGYPGAGGEAWLFVDEIILK
ncbi:chitobiase/beta-hexosaminidase C-terminal domain-containing protein [Parapedobacter defluvii]|nr:chitobiase/beta-hexosaminidase C-terminal domain-containing protein [Parapedobacter defluvii]